MSKLVRRMTQAEILESGWAGWCGEDDLYFVLDVEASEHKIMEELAKMALKTKKSAYVVHNTYMHFRVVGWSYVGATKNKSEYLSLCVIEGSKTYASFECAGYNPVALREK